MKKSFTLGLAVVASATVVALTFVSCGSDTSKDTGADAGTGTTTTSGSDTVSFTADVKPIIIAKCATSSCHVTGKTTPNYSAVSETSWTKTGLSTITNGTMPPKGSTALTAAELTTVKAYTPKQ